MRRHRRRRQPEPHPRHGRSGGDAAGARQRVQRGRNGNGSVVGYVEDSGGHGAFEHRGPGDHRCRPGRLGASCGHRLLERLAAILLRLPVGKLRRKRLGMRLYRRRYRLRIHTRRRGHRHDPARHRDRYERRRLGAREFIAERGRHSRTAERARSPHDLRCPRCASGAPRQPRRLDRNRTAVQLPVGKLQLKRRRMRGDRRRHQPRIRPRRRRSVHNRARQDRCRQRARLAHGRLRGHARARGGGRAGEHRGADRLRRAAGRPDPYGERRWLGERRCGYLRLPVADLRPLWRALRSDRRCDRRELHAGNSQRRRHPAG